MPTELFSTKTISDGGSETTSTIDSNYKNVLVIQIDGDSNSSDMDVVLQGKVKDEDSYSWSEIDKKTNEDITATSNNSKVYTYDVQGEQTNQLKLDNNAGTGTDVTVLAYTY